MENEKFDRKNLIIVLIFLLVLTVFFFFTSSTGNKEESTKVVETNNSEFEMPEMRVDSRAIVLPDMTEPYAKFYFVQNQWGYGLVQFKDTSPNGPDKKLDKVFLSKSEISMGLRGGAKFDIYTGYPSDITIDPNSPDWDEWVSRFEKALQELAKRLHEVPPRRD